MNIQPTNWNSNYRFAKLSAGFFHFRIYFTHFIIDNLYLLFFLQRKIRSPNGARQQVAINWSNPGSNLVKWTQICLMTLITLKSFIIWGIKQGRLGQNLSNSIRTLESSTVTWTTTTNTNIEVAKIKLTTHQNTPN